MEKRAIGIEDWFQDYELLIHVRDQERNLKFILLLVKKYFRLFSRSLKAKTNSFSAGIGRGAEQSRASE